MAVAAYVAILSLIDVLDRILDPSMHRLHLDRKQIEALRDKVSFLQDFLELHHSQRISEEILLGDLMREIFNVAVEAEDVVESHVVDQIRKGFPDQRGVVALFCENIERVMGKIESIQGKLMMVKEIMTVEQQRPRDRVAVVSTAPPSSSRGKNTMVGFDEQLVRLMDVLTATGHKSDLQILPIVGMGGIGKTTLARSVFEHPYIVHHYHLRLWVTISQEYSVQEILLRLLQDLGVLGNRENTQSSEELAKLGEKLYKSLSGREYLIVMDDVWSTKVWDDARIFFPDNKNSSRIMVTTRMSNLAVSFGSSNPFFVDFLNEDQSWSLFCEKAFTAEDCPPELEEVGKSIAKSCKGLPLAIAVIGGLLSKSNMTREYWEFVAKDVSSFANSGYDEHCLKILSLSYNHLPIHLKPCFLYMRVFHEDDKIAVRVLISFWIAEGFIKPTKDKTLEEVADGYLKDLTERNLILIHKWTRTGKMKFCGIHDLLRDFCIRESRKEHFYRDPKVQIIRIGSGRCCICNTETSERMYHLEDFGVSQPKSLFGYLHCHDCTIEYEDRYRFILVKAAEDILHPSKLRWLFIYGHVGFEGNLNLPWNLQFLYIKSGGSVLPSEIWEMPQLRGVFLKGGVLYHPPVITEVERKDSIIILKNLQTLSSIENFRWSEDVVERIPNLKRLKISYDDNSAEDWSDYSLHNLGRLNKLESLNLDVEALLTLKHIAFPHSLKKLTLWHCEIPWEEMTIIGSLPNLEALRLNFDAFEGPEWNPIEGEFARLKLLFIEYSNLKCWGAEKIHFPKLEHLELRFMEYLEEIPLGIGETLRSIRMDYCSESAVNSAKEILEEQHSFGNEDLQLYVESQLVLLDSS